MKQTELFLKNANFIEKEQLKKEFQIMGSHFVYTV